METKPLMPFGRYRGQEIAKVPADYLFSLYKEGLMYGELKRHILENINEIKAELKIELK